MRLQLAGAPRLHRAGRELHTGTRKALTLALLVALEPGVRRTRAAELLWPEADLAAGRRNLRRDLFRLRQLGLALSDGAGDGLTLADAEFDWPPAAALPPRWLDGLDEVAGNELSHWVEQQRALLQRRWIDQLADRARLLESSDPAAAAHAWRAVLAEGAGGPDHTEARRALARLQPDGPTAEGDADLHGGPRPGAPAGLRLLQTPFVGRTLERQAIDSALAAGKWVLLDGSPGVGKTRLALEVLAARGGVLLLRCRQEDTAVPYASALRGLQTLREAAPDVQLPAWVRRDLSLLVPDWAGRSAPDADPPRLQRAYAAALHALADGNFEALVIDDWQWADASSQTLWQPDPPANAGTLPCVVVHRSGELPLPALQRRRSWLDQGQAVAVHVAPLPPNEARALLHGVGDLSEADQDRLIERSAGNPLFLIETLRHLQQGGDAIVPASVHDLVVARSRALGPLVRRVLEAASMAGDDLRPALLAAAAGIDTLAVVQSLEHATVAELLLADSRGRHRFAHDLIAQAIGDSLSAVRQRALHGQLAAGLITENAEPGRIARHLDQADRALEATRWHLLAAQVAVQRQAWAEARVACDAVLAAATDPALRLDARLCCAQVQRRQSEPLAAEATLQAAWADAARAGPARVIDLCLERIELLSHRGRADEALAELQRLDTDPALQPAQRHRLRREWASALAYAGRNAESLPQLRQMLADLPASALAERQRIFSLLARNAYWAGELDEARQVVEQSLALSRSLGDESAVASGLYRLGVLDRERGLTDAAFDCLGQAAELARQTGFLELHRSALSTMATVRLDRMQLAEAEALLVEGEQAAPHWDSPSLEDVFDERRCRLHHLRGEVDAAWVVCQRSIARNRDLKLLHSQMGSLAQAIGLAVASGDTAQARRHLDEALALERSAGGESLYGRELSVAEVQVLRDEGRAADALRLAEAWLAAPLTRRVEAHARLLAAAAQAALDLGQAPGGAALLAQADALPEVPVPVQALLLAARLRCARAGAGPMAPAMAAARAWLAMPVLPALEAQQLRDALAAVRVVRASTA